jgi:molybdopterin converting factor small subunit
MITVHTEFHSHFKEVAATETDTFELDRPLVSELARRICDRYGPRMHALLIDPESAELNPRGTLIVDAEGRRVSIEDTLADGDVITFMMGIAGG